MTVYLKIGDHQLDSVILSPENNWTAAFTQLPDPDTLNEGLQYAVVENPVPSDFEPQYQEAVIDGNKIYITINNQYIEPPSGALTVSKAVTGNAGNTEAEFHFTVTLNDTTINGVYGDMTFKNGVAEFTLKHGERKTAAGLPAGIHYTVTESCTGYQVTATGEQGTISENQSAAAVFNNVKETDTPPDTPDEPDVPGEPEDPENPETPNPVEPEKPENPDAPNQNVQDDVTPDSPKTGDTSALNFWLTLTAVTALALTAVVCAYQYPARKKHTHHRK